MDGMSTATADSDLNLEYEMVRVSARDRFYLLKCDVEQVDDGRDCQILYWLHCTSSLLSFALESTSGTIWCVPFISCSCLQLVILHFKRRPFLASADYLLVPQTTQLVAPSRSKKSNCDCNLLSDCCGTWFRNDTRPGFIGGQQNYRVRFLALVIVLNTAVGHQRR
jgi:hypothetical protein